MAKQQRITSVYLPSTKTVYRIGHHVIGTRNPVHSFRFDGVDPVRIHGYDYAGEKILTIVTNESVIVTYDDSTLAPDFSSNE